MKLQIDGHTAYAYTGGRPLDPRLPGVVFATVASTVFFAGILAARRPLTR